MTDYKGKRFCVLGDSISTFSGYTPEEAVFYNSYMQRMTGVTDVNLTWWMQVINHFGGVLGVNNSYAGSTVYGTRPTSGNSDERTQALGAAGEPDVILISMGGNDCAFGFKLKEFGRYYRRMLRKLTELYPNAEIWCGNLMRGKIIPGGIPFFNTESMTSRGPYQAVIEKEAPAAGCHVAKLGTEFYEAYDGAHPTLNGMNYIAQCWIEAIEKGDQ